MTEQPAAWTRFSSATFASHDGGAYSWYQTGWPRAALTSSTLVDVAVDRTCSVLRALAARATASSPSGWNDFSPPVGQRKIGLAYVVPNSSTRMSTFVA